jgi:site-specific recombinase XerD
MRRKLSSQKIREFEIYLINEERSRATVEKYVRDVKRFSKFVQSEEIDKREVLDYKSKLGETYAVTSANSMIAAMNCFFRFCGWHDLCVKQFRVQREAYCSEDRELTRTEYIRLIGAANARCNERLNLIIQTICGTGIRVSELEYITVEALRSGEATVNCKGKKTHFYCA